MKKKVFDKLICKCNKCSHVWIAIVEYPAKCPICKTFAWDRNNPIPEKKHIKAPVIKHIRENIIEPEIKKVEINEEDYRAAFNCALSKQLNCDIYNAIHNDTADRVVIPFSYCKACADGKFWSNADNMKEFLFNNKPKIDIQKDDDMPVKANETEKEKLERQARECTFRVTLNGISNCSYFNEKVPVKKACTLCWELEDIWKHLAVRAKPKNNI